MLRCTYIVLTNNNAPDIPRLIDSLKKINGNFRKEFIIVDDGSKDNSLSVLKAAVNDLPRTTIIAQENLGPAISINKAISLSTGDYIHFIEGDEIVHQEASSMLIEACTKLGTQVAFGLLAKDNINFNSEINPSSKLIQMPINEILVNKLSEIRNIGRSGSLVHHDLLEKVGKCDSSIYTQNMSLSLRCAKYSKFAFLNNIVSTVSSNRHSSYENKFEAYNNLKAIHNFVKSHPDIFSNLLPELLKTLSNEVLDQTAKINYSFKSLSSRYLNSITLDKILEHYRKELDKLF